MAFYFEVVPGSAGVTPLLIPASQVVVRLGDGTPVCVIQEHGRDGDFRCVQAGDPEFDRVLLELGIQPPQVNRLRAPPPPSGARLLQRG